MPSFAHQPVLLGEVLNALKPRTDRVYGDGTLGGGGHAEAILEASSPAGRLRGCDRDGEAVEAARARLARFGSRVEICRGNYAEWLESLEPGSLDGVLLDLGVSSPQLDRPERGFSFQQDGPLDMRMDRDRGPSAADLVNEWSEAELAGIFWKYGDEPNGRRFAREIARAREAKPFRTTLELAALIERLAPRRGRKTHPATRVFQALRMAVNDELGSLRRGLAAAVAALSPEGRLAVITFHSLEDRMVKLFGRERARDYDFPGEVDVPELRVARSPELRWVSRKAILPGPAELADNPRSRSAQLRVLEKV